MPRHLIAAAGNNTPTAGEQLYQQLYGKEIGMMRKMAGVDDDVKYGIPPGFQRPGTGPGPGPSTVPNGGVMPQHHPNLPPNMMPDAIMYNKFQQQQQQTAATQPHPPYFHNGEPSPSSSTHLHKMEGLLKPCFDDHNQHPHHPHQLQQQHQYSNSYGSYQSHHHHPFGPNSNMMESPFVNNFNGNNNNKSNAVGNGGGGSNGGTDLLNSPGPGTGQIQIKQENDTILYGRGSNNSSNPINGNSNNNNNNNVSSKAEPNEFNLNYSNSTIKGENHTDDDSGIDKLTRLNDNDTDQ